MGYSSEEMRKVVLELADDLEQQNRMLKEAQVQASLMTSEESEAVERSLLGGMTLDEVATAAGSGTTEHTGATERETEEHLCARLAGYSMEDLGTYRKHVAKRICHLVLMGGTALRGVGQEVFESSVEKLRCIDAEIGRRT